MRTWAGAPGSGVRAVQIQRTSGGNEVNDGGLVRTNSRGYFIAKRRSKSATYLFLAYRRGGDAN